MKQFESEHYCFSYGDGSRAERDIGEIAAYQEACFRYLCGVLKVTPDFKIRYILCDSPEEVSRIYGDDEPCNGFAVMPDTIYAVYNDSVQCIGFHEDAHIISYMVNWPDCPAIKEGLAMYFDRKWWGIQNMDWTGYYLKRGAYIAIDRLLDKETFFDNDCSVTYPIMGAFTDYLISTYGIETYLRFYREENMADAMQLVFGKSPQALNGEFVEYVRLFRTDEAVEKRMEELAESI